MPTGPFPFTVICRTTTTRRSPNAARTSSLKNGVAAVAGRRKSTTGCATLQADATGAFARDDIKLFSAVVAHYIGDAFQPFHAALNYDGQLTGQQGVHARFETELFERYQDACTSRPAPLAPVAERPRIHVRHADRQLQLSRIRSLPPTAPPSQGRTAYDDVYFAKFFEKTSRCWRSGLRRRSPVSRRLITAAWTEAGKPAVPAGCRRRARRATECAGTAAPENVGHRTPRSASAHRSIARSIGARISSTISVIAPADERQVILAAAGGHAERRVDPDRRRCRQAMHASRLCE